MKYILLTLTIILFSSCAVKNSNLSQRSISNNTDRYLLSFNELNPKLVNIEAKITLQDSLLRMSEYGPIPHRWPQYVQNLKIKDNKGQLIQLQKRDSTAWIVDNSLLGQQIDMSYEVKIDHEEKTWPGGIDGVAFVRD